MYSWRKVLLFSFNLLRQRRDISVLLFIVCSHALWRGRMYKFGPIRNHYHVHLVDRSTRVGCSTFCCATPCRREPTSSKQLSTVAAFCWFSVWSLLCRCRVKSTLQKFESFIFRSFTDPPYTCSIFVCGPLLIVYQIWTLTGSLVLILCQQLWSVFIGFVQMCL